MNAARVRSTFLGRIQNRLGGGLSDDSGFTLVEIAVASGVILMSLMLLAGVLVNGLASTAIARERQSANSLANQTIEKVRALPFDSLRRGLDTTDLATGSDPNITTSGCGGGAYCFQGEQIVRGTNAPIDPLVPHKRTVNSGDSTDKTFTTAAYVTYYENDLTGNSYRVTAQVSWTSAVRQGSTQTVEAQTLIFPNGCASLPAHPYSGPCQSSFTASATMDPATITVSGNVAGVDLTKAVVYGPASSSDATIEQTARVEGVARGHAITVQAAGSEEQMIGGPQVSSQADNDPEATKDTYESRNMASPAGNATISGGWGSLSAAVTAGNSGRTTSTTSASTAESRNCPNITGIANETDSAPCGGSNTAIGAAATLNAALSAGLLSGTLPLASIGSQTSPNRAIIDRTTSTGVDRASATAARTAVTMGVGGLPNVTGVPAGFTNFVQLTNYTDSVTTQAGVGSVAPTIAATGGKLRFYTGALLSPYTEIDLSTITPSSIPTIPTLNLPLPLLGTTISMSATVTPQSAETTSSCTGTCTRTSASAKVTPIKVAVSLTITAGGSEVVNTSLVLDPGTINAKASYVAAPTS